MSEPSDVSNADGAEAIREQLAALLRFCRRVQLTMYNHEHVFGFILDDRSDFGTHTVAEVIAGSAAERAGMRKEDCIVEIDGVNVCNESRLQCSARIAAAKDKRRVALFVLEPRGLQLCRDYDIAATSRWFRFSAEPAPKKGQSFNTTPATQSKFFRRSKSTR